MQKWILKTAIQNSIGRLPKSYYWNSLFQKYVTNGYYPSLKSFEGKLNCCRQHLDYYQRFSKSPKSDFVALELGTGWWPIVPIGLYLCGAREIWSFDMVPLLRRDLLKSILKFFNDYAESGELKKFLKSVIPERVLQLKELSEKVETYSPTELLDKINIKLCIGDAQNTKLPDKSIDLIFSTVVLEQITAEILSGLLSEFFRVASENAVMSHHIGLIDQFASFDESINGFNFLKYTDRQWRFLNNPVIPQSRLRITDYRELFEQVGWKIVEENNTLGLPEDLNKIKLAPKFATYSKEDLLVLFSWLASIRAAD